jgi:hypothetical protein
VSDTGANVKPPPSGVARVFDTTSDNPYVHFFASEAWAGGTGLVVFVLFRCLAWSTYICIVYVRLIDDSPGMFLEQVLSWALL